MKVGGIMTKKLFITNDNTIFKLLSKAFSCVPDKDAYISSDGRETVILQIDGLSTLKIKGIGTRLFSFFDGTENITITTEYSTLNDLKRIKDYAKNETAAQIVNACTPNSNGQYVFNIALRCLNIDYNASCIRRLWVNSMEMQPEEIENLPLNNTCNKWFESYLCEKVIESYWRYRSEDLFGIKVPVSVKELLILVLLQEREHEISNKQVAMTFNVYAHVNGIKFKVMSKQNDPLTSHEQVIALKDHISDKQAFIVSKTINGTKIPHPLLYNNVDLIKDAKTSKVGSLEEIKNACESLYRRGYITNPNTSINHVSRQYLEENTIPILQGLYSARPDMSMCIEYIEKLHRIEFSSRTYNDKLASTHQAIVPTKTIPEPSELNPVESAMYALIAKRFLSVFMGDADKVTLSVHGLIDHETSIKYEKTIEFEDGWKLLLVDSSEFYEYSKKFNTPDFLTDAFNNINIDQATLYPIEDITIETSAGKNKLRYSIPSLLTALQNAGKNIRTEKKKILYRDKGIGVEVDKSVIITAMENNKLITLEEERVQLTALGQRILDTTPMPLLQKEYLSSMNEAIKDIQEGRAFIKSLLAEHCTYLNELISHRNIDSTEEVFDYSPIINDKRCPYCYCSIRELDDKLSCYSCSFHIPKIMYGYTLKTNDIMALFDDGYTPIISKFIFKGGRKRNGTGRLRLDHIAKKPKLLFDND